MKIRWETGVTTLLVVCALATTSLVLYRVVWSPRNTAPVAHSEQKAKFVPNWRSLLSSETQMGSPAAPVQLVEFADFECPFCGEFYKKLKAALEHYPSKLTVIYVHFPLQGHRFALPAARVAECASDQGRFEAMYEQLFEGQDQFGLKPWREYAAAAEVPDLNAFDACMKKVDLIPRVEEGKALGAKLDVRGTPTIIINGWKLGHPPSEQELDEMVLRILAGKQPVDAKS
jgi:protein-disulfide isomerase